MAPFDQLEECRKPDYRHLGGGSRRCDEMSFLFHTSGSVGGATRSYGCTCYDWSYDQDVIQCATTDTLPRRAAGGNLAVRSSWDNVTSPTQGGRASRERARRLLALRRLGAKVDGMANSGELLINVVRSSKPKALRGLNQKVRGQVQGGLPSPVVAVGATGGEAEPKPSMIHP